MKKIVSLSITILLITLSVFPSFATNVSIDGNNVQFSDASGSPFIDQSNRTQVPFRLTMEQFGCTVSWDAVNKIAIAEKDGITVQVPIGAPYILKDGQKITNDTAALIKDGRTYLPIRAVLEAFGAKVSWNNATNTVVVSTSGGDNSNASSNSDAYNLDGLEFTIGDIGLTNALHPYVLPDDGDCYVAFTVKIENKTTGVVSVGPSNFAVATLDSIGISAYEDALAANYTSLITENTLLQPGQWVAGLVVFEIPYSSTPVTIDIGLLNLDAKTIHVLRYDVSKFNDMLNK